MGGIDGGNCPVCSSRGSVWTNWHAENYTCFCGTCGFGTKFKLTRSNDRQDKLMFDKRRAHRKFARPVTVMPRHKLGFTGKVFFYPDKDFCPSYSGNLEIVPVIAGSTLKWRLYRSESIGKHAAMKKIVGEYAKFIQADKAVAKMGY